MAAGSVHRELYVKCSERDARGQPQRRIIDSQSVKSAEKRGGASIRMATMPKLIKGGKRHILVDTLDLSPSASVHRPVFRIATVQRSSSTKLRVPCFGIGDHAPRWPPLRSGSWIIEIVKRTELHNCASLPKRWIVERTIAWLNRCRRLAKDWENLNRKALAFLRLASIRLMLRKLCNPV